MKLITKEIETAFKKQGYVGNKHMNEIRVICKFFNPMGAGTWYVYEKIDDIMYAFVNLNDPQMAECGAVSFEELKNLRLPFGMSIERDMSFPIGEYVLSELIEKVKSGQHI